MPKILITLTVGILIGSLAIHAFHIRNREIQMNIANTIISAYELIYLAKALDDRGTLPCRISRRADQIYDSLRNTDRQTLGIVFLADGEPAEHALEAIGQALNAYELGKASQYADRCS